CAASPVEITTGQWDSPRTIIASGKSSTGLHTRAPQGSSTSQPSEPIFSESRVAARGPGEGEREPEAVRVRAGKLEGPFGGGVPEAECVLGLVLHEEEAVSAVGEGEGASGRGVGPVGLDVVVVVEDFGVGHVAVFEVVGLDEGVPFLGDELEAGRVLEGHSAQDFDCDAWWEELG
ncbi:hypothetical protein STAS_02914, partial [Striga asiatica]